MIKYLKQLLNLIFPMSGIKFGDIDIGDQVVDNEYKIRILNKIVALILQKAAFTQPITQQELDKLVEEAAKEIKDKYPNSGIQIKK